MDFIGGTHLDNAVLAIAGVLAALTTIAACAHKPPFRQLGVFVGWLFRRLVGEPLEHWFEDVVVRVAVPAVLREVAASVPDVDVELSDWRDSVDLALAKLQQALPGPHPARQV